MRPGPRLSALDIEKTHVLSVLLDDLAPRLDLIPHQHGEDAVGHRGVLHLDTHEHAAGGVHGRVPELGGVHLAETLEARDLNALLGEVEGGRPELSKRLDLARLLSERDRERRQPDYP